MRAALEQAGLANMHHDVPVGAVLLDTRGNIVAADHNRREEMQDPTAHAEMLVLSAAARERKNWRLTGHTLVVTLEPCAMCAGAIVQARIPLVVFGAFDDKAGAAGSLMNLLADIRLNHQPEVISGFMAEESKQLMLAFFKKMREKTLRRGG